MTIDLTDTSGPQLSDDCGASSTGDPSAPIDRTEEVGELNPVAELAAGVAEDLNNMVTVVRGYTGLLLSSHHLDEEAEDSLLEVRRATERAEELVRKLMLLTSHRMVQPLPLDLNLWVENWLARTERAAGGSLDLSSRLPTIEADCALLEEALGEVVRFLRQLKKGSSTVLEVSTRAVRAGAGLEEGVQVDDAAREFVELRIASPGQRLDRRALLSLFVPYSSSRRMTGGRGPGLAIVLAIVRQHGGRLKVESSPRTGLAFRFLFPAPSTVS